jgi:hypothetical protein
MTTILQDRNGPDWPLGFIAVPTPGTPVPIMSNVDAANANAPQTLTPPVPNSATRPSNEYTATCQQIMFQGYKAGAAPPAGAMNTGLVYIVRKGGSKTDLGTIVKILAPGETFFLASAALNLNVLSPYRYEIDADNAADGALVTLIVQ